jgi:rhodanese-related sulfurtransferase
MNKLVSSTVFALALSALGSVLPNVVRAEDEPPCPFYENRSGLCGYYHSEISPAEAYVTAVVNGGSRELRRASWGRGEGRAVILDVRSTPEYKAGHPEHAYNVPYPYIYQYCDDRGRRPDGACFGKTGQIDQDPAAFVSYVEGIVPDKDTPIYTLCRTGVRSVGAANVLTDAGYTHVRNIWEGFVGIYLEAPKVTGYVDDDNDPSTPDVPVIEELPVDLNHDGKLTDDDKNGWRNHQGLPYDTRLLRPLIYRPYAYLYDLAE